MIPVPKIWLKSLLNDAISFEEARNDYQYG